MVEVRHALLGGARHGAAFPHFAGRAVWSGSDDLPNSMLTGAVYGKNGPYACNLCLFIKDATN